MPAETGEGTRNHLMKHLLSGTTQDGISMWRTALSNLLGFMDHVAAGIDEEIIAFVCYLGPSEALDSVSHRWLVEMIRSFGIKGLIFHRLLGFLSSKSFHSRVGNQCQEQLGISNQVSQEPPFGPPLLLLDHATRLELPCFILADKARVMGAHLYE